MPSASLIVRDATSGDAEQIAQVQLRTWLQMCTDLLPAEALSELTLGTAVQRWTAAIATPPSEDHRVLVASDGADIAGFVTLQPVDEDDGEQSGSDDGTSRAEIGILLVEPSRARQGHGSRLLAAATDTLAERGVEIVTTWVLDQDRVLQNFLSAAGWGPEGSVRELDTGTSVLRQVRLHSRLPATPDPSSQETP